MARSKVKVEWSEDLNGIPCLRVSCKSGRLNAIDVYEALENDYPGCIYVHLVKIYEGTPDDLYDEGDEWLLYEPYYIIKPLIGYSSEVYEGQEKPEDKIIRCKDCKAFCRQDTWFLNKERTETRTETSCQHGLSCNPEGFCHRAERREP